jgi:hypothetical protein
MSIGLAACQQAAPPEPVAATSVLGNTSFRNCVDREANIVFQSAIKNNDENAILLYGYPIDIENEIISTCNPRLSPEGLQDNIYTTNPYYSYINTAAEAQAEAARHEKAENDISAQRKQAELDAPRLKAEKEEERTAGDIYYLCLVRHTQILSLISNEPAEVIVQASFPSCSGERQAVFDVYRRHNNTLYPEAMDIAERKFRQRLLLEVIKARAQRPTPSEPPRAKPESPI